ncbi:MAG: tRNA (adenosine(37)-N6)-threonylcarbamoyltransferase complex ATPase subunit type 1 TsaE, partial [Actinomycetia bacterium]|nr:tRNA (adenosine(37)-N6)-threonylcarbamoyltransferase complex ATPase subunit type 1 TsaE [Actinomycetes bacterium]
MIFNFKTYSPEETEKQAFKLAGYLKQGDLILLCGDLGAGKTCFVKGLVKGIKLKDKVTSPSFVI